MYETGGKLIDVFINLIKRGRKRRYRNLNPLFIRKELLPLDPTETLPARRYTKIPAQTLRPKLNLKPERQIMSQIRLQDKCDLA